MSESSRGGWSDAAETPGSPVVPPELPSTHRYRIDGPLGQGGMGEVFRAWDAVLQRFVALKCVHARHDSPVLRVRLLREARVTARLEHPGILPILDAGELPDGRLFYTMRMVTGTTLADAAPTLTEAERLRHVVEAVRAVAYAHAQQTLHRDLKPSNIMVGALGETYVVDWGLARPVDGEDDVGDVSVTSGSPQLTTIGAVVGTQRYLSPDGLRGETKLSSDVFALGASLIEVMTGRRVQQSNEWALLAQTLDNPVLSAIAQRAVDPANRYPSARELLADLTSYVENQPVGAYNYSTLEYLGQVVRRHRWPVALAATALVVGGGVATIGTVRVMQERDRAVEAESLARAAQHRADAELAESLVRQAWSAAQDVRFADAELAAARAMALSPDPRATGVLMASMALTPRFEDHSDTCEGQWVTGVEGRACVPDETSTFEPANDGGFWQLGASSARHVGVDGTSHSQEELFGYRHDVRGPNLLRSNRHALNLWLGRSTFLAAEPCDGHMIDTARLAPSGVWGVCDDDRLFHMDWRGQERYLPIMGTDQYHRSAAVDGDRFFAIRDSVIDELDLTTGERLRVIEPRAGLLRGVEASDDWLFTEGADMPATLVRRTTASRPVMRTSIQWDEPAMTRAGEVVTTSGPDWSLILDDGLMGAAHFEEGISSVTASTAGDAVVVARGGARFAVVDLSTMAIRWNAQLPSEQVGKSAAFDPTDTTVLASVADFDTVMRLDASTGERLGDGATIITGCRRLVTRTSGWWCIGTGRRWLYSEAGGVRGNDELWVDLSASGQRAAIALTESGRMARLRDDVEWVDGRTAQGRVGVDATGEVMAWDTEAALWALHPRTGTHSLSPRPERILDVAVSPDGQWVAASGMDTVDVWRSDTGEHVASLPALHEERVASLVFTQDLLVTSGWDGQVRKWSLAPLTVTPTPDAVRRRWRLPR